MKNKITLFTLNVELEPIVNIDAIKGGKKRGRRKKKLRPKPASGEVDYTS